MAVTERELTPYFAEQFEALTGNAPYPWQELLFSLFLSGSLPNRVSLPTATGKTSIMAIWLLALAQQARINSGRVTIPRRLIWVVNRRVVVDQATSEAEILRLVLNSKLSINLVSVKDALASLCALDVDNPLAISTLRGQFADNAEWGNDPSRPSIIVGTVDMIGSRLLFSGYGRGFKSRPLHAGFLGQDALLVHDEAHLEPAFQSLITNIQSEQSSCGEFGQFRGMALTATSRSGDGHFALTDADLQHEGIRTRIEAQKGMAFCLVEDEKQIATKVTELALGYKVSGKAIIIFLRRLDDVESVAKGLREEKQSVQTLTGTLRGLERDAMSRNDEVFARFLRNPGISPRDGTVYLICTSAGEVGVNISADHLVCDLTPFDSMAQRFGRVNRFGGGNAEIQIVCRAESGNRPPEKMVEPFVQACEGTLLVLQQLDKDATGRFDASPKALGILLSHLTERQREAVFTPPPLILPTSNILFDAWALTSIRGILPGRPPVADWLHGVADWEPPATFVAWREEVERLNNEQLVQYCPEDLLEDYPLKPHELLRETADRVFKHLELTAKRCPYLSVWVIQADGMIQVTALDDLVAEYKKQKSDLANCTILLPPKAGALGFAPDGRSTGMLNGGAGFEERHRDAYDVADKWLDENASPQRCRVLEDEERPTGMRLIRIIDTIPHEDGQSDEDQPTCRGKWYWYVRPKLADDDGSGTSRESQELKPHLEVAEYFAVAITKKLAIKTGEAHAIALAARWHDLGKGRPIWQRSIGNTNASVVLAKSAGCIRSNKITDYRHEFGSVLDVSNDPEFDKLTPDNQDLVLHLIASHHGRARPHFSAKEAFDFEFPEQFSIDMARESPRRFSRLQRKYGRWGLAYLESLVRAADALASQNKSAHWESSERPSLHETER